MRVNETKQQLCKNIINYFYDKEYIVSPNLPIKTNDPTLPFINATITPFKSLMIESQNIENSVHIQDCFRSRFDTNFLFYFTMFGMVGNIDSLDIIMTDLLQMLADVFNIPQSELYIVVHEENKRLIDTWKKNIITDSIYFLDKNIEKYHVDWKYGENVPLIGRGLTISYINKNVSKCSDSCDVFCDCSKYLPLGNVIIISNLKSQKEYIDVGFGVEFLQSMEYNGKIFELPEFKMIINKVIALGFDNHSAIKIFNYARGIKKLLEEEVKVEQKSEGYILKRLLRNIFELCLKNNEIHVDRNIYNIMEYFQFSEEHLIIIIDAFEKYQKGIKSGISSVKKYLRKNKLHNSEDLHKKFKDTYGIPDFITSRLIKEVKNG